VLRPSSQTKRGPSSDSETSAGQSHQGAKFASDGHGQWPHGPEMPAIESTFVPTRGERLKAQLL
jgi:hypothetical protein